MLGSSYPLLAPLLLDLSFDIGYILVARRPTEPLPRSETFAPIFYKCPIIN